MAAVLVGRSCRCHVMKRLSRNVLMKNAEGCEAIVFNSALRNNVKDNRQSLITFESQRTFTTLSVPNSLLSHPSNTPKLLSSNRNFFKSSGSEEIDPVKLFRTLISLNKEIDSDLKKKFIKIAEQLLPSTKGGSENISLTEVKEMCGDLTPDETYDLASRMYSLSQHIGDEAVHAALPVFKSAAHEGHLNSKYTIGQLLLRGTPGVKPDPIEAAKLFTELAKSGHGYGQFALANMYYSGSGGLKQNFKHAFSLYEISTLNGVPQGYNAIGKLYLHGQGVDKDESKAAECFTKGAEAGDPSACTNAAHCYTNGKGVEVDHEKAFGFNSRSAELGNPVGMFNVGCQYFAGMGVDGVDYGKAMDYFEKAAANGFHHAKINLGNMYFQGLGVEKDWDKAKQLFEEASARVPEAKGYLKGLEEAIQEQNQKGG